VTAVLLVLTAVTALALLADRRRLTKTLAAVRDDREHTARELATTDDALRAAHRENAELRRILAGTEETYRIVRRQLEARALPCLSGRPLVLLPHPDQTSEDAS
jgi:septal ring factor EnvC (AmiA/AmiB activator)